MSKKTDEEYETITDDFIAAIDGVDAPHADYRSACKDAIERLRTMIQASEETSGDEDAD